jgi:putative phosphoribosyl transferase
MAQANFRPPVLVLGLPRGGVPVAYEVARALHAPLDVLVVRKIGLPGQPEIAIGAIAAGDILVRDNSIMRLLDEDGATFNTLLHAERHELERRERLYRAGLLPLDLKDQTAILVDDGLATGYTMLAAIRAARRAGAATTIVAAPIASREAAALIRREVDDTYFVRTPDHLASIGAWYARFDQLADLEVCRILQQSRTTHARIAAK